MVKVWPYAKSQSLEWQINDIFNYINSCVKFGFIWVLYEGGPQKTKFIYKKLCIYSSMFKLQSPSKYCPFDAIHLLRWFFHCIKQFSNSLLWMPFCASAMFCFTFSILARHFPLRTFFIQRNKQRVSGVRSDEQGGGGLGVMQFFGQRLLNTQHSVGQMLS